MPGAVIVSARRTPVGLGTPATGVLLRADVFHPLAAAETEGAALTDVGADTVDLDPLETGEA